MRPGQDWLISGFRTLPVRYEGARALWLGPAKIGKAFQKIEMIVKAAATDAHHNIA